MAEVFTVAKIWKQPNCSSMDEWINKDILCTHTHTRIHKDTHTGVLLSHQKKKNEILSFAATWMDYEDILLSEISQM